MEFCEREFNEESGCGCILTHRRGIEDLARWTRMVLLVSISTMRALNCALQSGRSDFTARHVQEPWIYLGILRMYQAADYDRRKAPKGYRFLSRMHQVRCLNGGRTLQNRMTIVMQRVTAFRLPCPNSRCLVGSGYALGKPYASVPLSR